MVKSRQWKTKLKSYENSSFNKDNTSSSSNVESVTEKINRLRIEQHRAEINRLRRSNPSHEHQSTSEMRYELNNAENLIPVPLTAGPPPPPSWRSSTRQQQLSVQNHQDKRVVLPPETNSSLYNMCAYQAANQIATLPLKKVWADVIPYLSAPVKQTLMQNISLIDGLNDTLFDVFVSFDYSLLCLERSRVSFIKFCKTYWKIKEQRQTEETDDWWDQDEYIEEGYVYNPIESITAEEMDIKDERKAHLEPILSALLIEQYPYKMIQFLLDNQGFILFSSFSSGLTCLNISFTVRWPNISFAHLLVTTLPGLQQLQTAGCFNASEGPRAIYILSQGLRMLTLWDIGFHPWLTFDIICGITGWINWRRDLCRLTMFYLQNLQEGVATHVQEWLISEGYRKIRVLE